MTIWNATPRDIDRILDLLSQVLEVHHKLRPDLFNSGVTKYRKEELAKMLFDDNNPIYVAKIDDELVAYAFCQIRYSEHPHLTKRQKTLYIDDFCVDQKHTRQGVGKELFEFIKFEAGRLGCEEITLNSWEGNDAANAFYEKMGLTVRSHILEYKIK